VSSTVYSSCSKNKLFDSKRLENNRRGTKEKDKVSLKFELRSHNTSSLMNYSLSVIKIKIKISMVYIRHEISEDDQSKYYRSLHKSPQEIVCFQINKRGGKNDFHV
jgi:hypothetical protein